MDRFFIAFVVEAPWPNCFPPVRLLEVEERHLTVAFLGKSDRKQVSKSFEALAELPLPLGFSGVFDSLLFLPQHSPRVVAYHAQLANEEEIRQFVVNVHTAMDRALPKKWLPHVTIGRSPFEIKKWQEFFSPLPFTVTSIALFESLGSLRYRTLSEISLVPTIEKLEHTADIAYFLRGKSFADLFRHALIALAFADPQFISFLSTGHTFSSIDEIIIELNRCIGKLDAKMGCPFKAVSFHDTVQERNGFYEWEMIVDV